MDSNSVQLMALEYVITVFGLLLGCKCLTLKKKIKYYWRFILSLDISLIVNIPIRLSEQNIVKYNPVFTYILYAVAIVLMTLVMYYWLLFILKEYNSRQVNSILKIHLSFLPAFLTIPLCIVNIWTGWLYTIDSASNYHRGSLFFLQGFIGYCYFAVLIITILRHAFDKKKSVPKLVWASVFALTFGIAGAILQILYGGSYLLAGETICSGIMFTEICLDQYNKEKIAENKEMFVQTAEALATAIDAKDNYTHGHSMRVAQYSRSIAERAGLSPEKCEQVYFSGLLHDVGKIGIPDWIITKQTSLTDEEYAQIKSHPIKGREILARIRKLPYLTMGAKYHHERYDGKGYPEGLKATDIPEIARVIAVADAYDAMTSNRSFRNQLPQDIVRDQISRGIGKQFDPKFAQVMLDMIDEDKDFVMKQNGNDNELYCLEKDKNFYEGIVFSPFETTVTLHSRKMALDPEFVPTFILYDAVDGRIHIEDEEKKFYQYVGYCEISMTGKYEKQNAKKILVEERQLKAQTPEEAEKNGMDIVVSMLKNRDHVLCTISNGFKEITVTAVLPDSSRYAYLGITGNHCYISEITVKKSDVMKKDAIKRIEKETVYFDHGKPNGDVPNLQISGWRASATKGFEILPEQEIKISFYMHSFPLARLIWHCPYVVIFDSDDGLVRGKNYRELAFIRFDGESWQEDSHSINKLSVTMSCNKSDFNWEDWKAGNRKGRNIEITIRRSGNQIFYSSACGDIKIKNVTTVSNQVNHIYAALTGDEVILEEIKIQK